MMEIKKHVKSSWMTSESDIKERPWGTEVDLPGFGGIHGKILFIKEGCRTSLKYHHHKDEALYVKSGKVEFLFGDELTVEDPVDHKFKRKIAFPGQGLKVQSSCPYRITALEDSEIIEIGNRLQDIPIRLEDDYGREIINEKNS
jgi:hypothetical protein